MAHQNGAFAAEAQAASTESDENLREPDYERLDLSFDDVADFDIEPKVKTDDDDLGKGKLKKELDILEDYILGTLIVRVVAARNLESVDGPGIGKFLGFGRSYGRAGTANPYAIARFGSTTQRTSVMFGTVDPIWPRGETMYMDVTHPPIDQRESSNASATSTTHSHPGDPPKKEPTIAKPRATMSLYSSESGSDESSTNNGPAEPVLTVAVFHTSENGTLHKFPSKGPMGGDSDDVFLGMAAVNLTQLITGKLRTFDEWLILSGCESSRASVRVVCEYEASDPPPHAGDLVKFTKFCHPNDLYPALVEGVYHVEENDVDQVLISYTSQEGWISSFLVHRFMLVCIERHQGAMGLYQEEMISIAQRLSHSPIANVIEETLHRVPDEGLLDVGVNAVQGGASLLTRWLEGGFSILFNDVAFATNWDGRFNPDSATSLATGSYEEVDTQEAATGGPDTKQDTSSPYDRLTNDPDDIEPLPNMPSCPITREPMREPVVAADGHTYERAAIVRWLQTSDKSPLTGSVLPHKNLVPNYMLMSSLQDALVESFASVETVAGDDDSHDIDEHTAEVQID